MLRLLLTLTVFSTWNMLEVFGEGEQSPPVVQQSTNMFNNLTLETFEQSTKEKDIMLVLFFVPWCPHSKAIQPEWEKASNVLEQQKEYVLGRVNCEDSGKTLCEKYDVKKYPTVKLFRHGQFQEDFDGRNADSLIDFVQRAQSTNGPVGTTPTPSTSTTSSPPQQTGASLVNSEQQTQQQPQAQVVTQYQSAGENVNSQQQQVSAPVVQTQNQPQIAENAPVNPPSNPPSNTPAGGNSIQGFQSENKLSQQKAGPSLMSLYESVSKTKGGPHPLYPQTFHSQGPVGTAPASISQEPFIPKRDAAIMNYVMNRHEEIKQSPGDYQRLVTSKDVDQIKKYYEWKFKQLSLPEKEKQKRIELGSMLLGDKRAKD